MANKPPARRLGDNTKNIMDEKYKAKLRKVMVARTDAIIEAFDQADFHLADTLGARFSAWLTAVEAYHNIVKHCEDKKLDLIK